MTKEMYLVTLDSGSKYYDPGTHTINDASGAATTFGTPYKTLHLKARNGNWIAPNQFTP